MREIMMRLHAERCGLSYGGLERAMDRDVFMMAEQALEGGLLDRILPVRERGELSTGVAA